MTCSNFCAILQCRRINKATWDMENGITYFVVPKNSFEKWKDIVPNLKKGSRLCIRHFDESDIIKGLQMGSIFHEYLRWQLKKGACPKRFLLDSDYPEETRQSKPKKNILLDKTLYGNGQKNSTPITKLSFGMGNLLNRDESAAVCPAGKYKDLAPVEIDLDLAQENNAITAKECAAPTSCEVVPPIPLDTGM
ncbi:Uncharacterized protein APZ42_025191 [Daphnia magna]|uniref:THAP-type domain-containing protein n=1 Tax=Daphnia magna TaxID=35525 RepID=A0A164TD05_9CRUS|nr:Uncharacterized protein APZ42_025191 [Daphnia magna]